LTCVEIGGAVCCRKKNTLERRRNEGGEEEVQSPNHKLNITDGFADEIIPLDILSVILSIKDVTLPYDLPF
jgi:hypothetical protein